MLRMGDKETAADRLARRADEELAARKPKLNGNGAAPHTDEPSRMTRSDPQHGEGLVIDENGTVNDAYTWWNHLALERSSGAAAPYANASNAVRILAGHPQYAGKIWYDSFHQRTFCKLGDGSRVEWSDTDDVQVLIWVQSSLMIPKMGVECVRQAVQIVARQDVRNEPQEWLTSLKWDQTPRLKLLMHKGFGTELTEYTEAVGRCWVMGMVARIMTPGAKVDALPVFEGKEELGKSTALALIGAPWFAECHESITSKDFYQVMQGKMLIEISELHAFRRADVDRLKGVISSQSDRYREPYGRRAEDHPRTCVFAGTTNRTNWNASDTGARRFWPVACGRISHGWIRINKAQLFAEAVALMAKEGACWWDVPSGDAQAEQEERRDKDAWEEVIERYIQEEPMRDSDGRRRWYPRKNPLESVSVGEILGQGLGIEEAKWSRGDQMRVSSALQSMKWERKRRDGGWKYLKIKEKSPVVSAESDDQQTNL
jgi:predicted P-loop ATPase